MKKINVSLEVSGSGQPETHIASELYDFLRMQLGFSDWEITRIGLELIEWSCGTKFTSRISDKETLLSSLRDTLIGRR